MSGGWFVKDYDSIQDRWNGQGIETFEVGQALGWDAVDGSSDSDVWLVSDEAITVGLLGGVAKWDGSEWTVARPAGYAAATFTAVWGMAGGSIWATTDTGFAVRFR